MKVEEGRSRGGAEAVKGRSDASRRRMSGGASVRRRVQVVDAAAPAPTTTTPLQRLLAACRRAFGSPGTVPARDDVALIRGILVHFRLNQESATITLLIVSFSDNIGPEDVHLSAVIKAAAASAVQRRRRPIVTRTTMYECTSFSIVVFLLPPGAVIPLHNHPGMTVFSKLLRGSLHVKSYDWAGADPPVAGGGSTPGVPALRLAKLVLDEDLRAPCGALVLFPESGGNMHQFAAAAACAVLDVLGPPYSGDRDCTYYQDLPYSHHHADDEAGDDVRAADEHGKARLGWLLETGKPKELEMYEVPYKGPPILWAEEESASRQQTSIR
ncbi:Plant cysteine oxidase 2 [Dichanthelium oligosanthes]|uniref:cysteine dioxygenase n=1 Tax=Dichanthelium oligosanthes TaxID=888268 RepID=A0A1E5WFS9_9POAL|nr:Plant cysteine oxidase 2 [Dichanthelium oligosanthes]